jgi:hypothetical protein
MAFEQVELASVPFFSFVANRNSNGDPTIYSFVLRRYVRHWLGRVWSEHDRIRLNDIVASKPAATGKSSARMQVVQS